MAIKRIEGTTEIPARNLLHESDEEASSTAHATDRRWQQVLTRDAGASFLYAVQTTGIFCRPACPSRRPAKAHVAFFSSAAEARAAGFRPCLRCRPEEPTAMYQLVTQVAAYLRGNLERHTSLAALARLTGRSPWTVQRVFSKATGLSPLAFANALRAEAFRAELQRGSHGDRSMRLTDAVYAAGFSGPNQAKHQAPLGMVARRYRAQGRGERIGYMIGSPAWSGGKPAPTLGLALVASTARGICAVLLGESADELTTELGRRFPAAEIQPDPLVERQLRTVFEAIQEGAGARELPLDLRATAFQARVWSALAAIPRGETRSYAEIACAIGNPKASRAVARACASNPAALLVPCHRVIGSSGSLTGYRWGMERKRALLEWEQRSEASSQQGQGSRAAAEVEPSAE